MKNALHFPQNFSRSVRMIMLSLLALGPAVCAPAQTLTYLGQFNGTNGRDPHGPLVQAPDANFYGQAVGPGAYGEIFRATPAGQISTLYSFCSQPECADGNSSTPPILGSDGSLYGVALLGSGGAYSYSGTLYRMTLDGKLTTLYTFCPSANCTYEQIPNGIVEDSDGNFYGTTFFGGTHDSGSIFKVTPTGQYTLLYSFCSASNCADGYSPRFPPILGNNGNFYGTALGRAGGVVYQMTPSGAYKVLHTFCYPCIEGGVPSRLVQDAKGNLFGTTTSAVSYNTGNVFEISTTHQYSILHTFLYGGGVDPGTGLILASDGNFYGIALNDNFDSGGGHGTIFEITPAGTFTTLHTFYNLPNGPLIQGADGSFYGTTVYGNGYEVGDGAVFQFSNGLGPQVKTVPASAKAGTAVMILGNHLTDTISVTFNGVRSLFTVESDTYIKATVPAGATTGTVSVVTPSRTLNSNPQFVVTK
jgi:uncharacterized repeat protein (TIGR03803 family)